MMKLYSYFRSSASFRVRIALNLKGLSYDYLPVHLLRAEQFAPEYRQLSPDALVPVLIDDAHPIQQSLAAIEYLEETHPNPPLLPQAPIDRAYVRGLALQVACEIHPLNNLRVLKYLKHELQMDDEKKTGWRRHWIETGLDTLEQQIARDSRAGQFCFGSTPTLADICVIPQVFNAQRLEIDTQRYPTLQRIYDAAMALDAFIRAAPAQQPDAE